MFRIGPYVIENPFLLAPMASVSEMPFRVMALGFGAGLATTELISSSGIFYKNRRTRQYMTFDPVREVPYSMQLFGGEPGVMAHAAREAWEHGAHIVDVNMGCPVSKVTKSGSGSALLCDAPRAASMVEEMRAACEDKVPITVKIRTGWDEKTITFKEVAHRLEDAGCAALAMHARTRAQGYSGRADWRLIGELKQHTKMPVIGNGDVLTFDDAHRMMRETGCDAVMIGRGALGNPWLFQSLKAGRDLGPPTPQERLRVIREHLQAHIAFHVQLDNADERYALRTPPPQMAVRTFRQHLVWYSRGLQGGSAFRRKVLTQEEPEEVVQSLEEFFGAAEPQEELHAEEAEGVAYNAAFG